MVFVLETGIAWKQLAPAWSAARASPAGGGCVTGPRRAGPALYELLLAELRASGALDLDRCAVDGSHVRALKGGTAPARRPSTVGVPVPSII
jgi:hypothetical protein